MDTAIEITLNLPFDGVHTPRTCLLCAVSVILSFAPVYRIHSFEHHQIHMSDLENDLFECVDMRAATDSILQPLSTQEAQRAGHPFTLIFIEHGSGSVELLRFCRCRVGLIVVCSGTGNCDL